VQQRFGAPHFVFNNAGVGSGGLIWENSVKDWEWVLGVNLWGVIHGVRLFTPMMLAAAKADPNYRGHIVNTASMAGLLTPPNMGIYNVSKHAVVSLTETLYQDLKLVTDQVSASVLCPYFVPTGISQSHRNKPAALADEKPTQSQLIGQAMSDKAVSSGKITAAQVAEMVFHAMRARPVLHLQPPQGAGQRPPEFLTPSWPAPTRPTRLPSGPILARACARRCARADSRSWIMQKFVNATRRFLRDEEGVTAIEYGLIAALIAVVIIGAVQAVGGGLEGVFNEISDALGGATGGGGGDGGGGTGTGTGTGKADQWI
jgi:NAD(P)-dependent dehydrogenase (short-subunit alcohol dehydrogenase family)/Flp pilus assembly pilin Flp